MNPPLIIFFFQHAQGMATHIQVGKAAIGKQKGCAPTRVYLGRRHACMQVGQRCVTRGGHEVINFTRSRVKTKSKLANLMKVIRIEGYNGK